jgi:hypothetical protein
MAKKTAHQARPALAAASLSHRPVRQLDGQIVRQSALRPVVRSFSEGGTPHSALKRAIPINPSCWFICVQLWLNIRENSRNSRPVSPSSEKLSPIVTNYHQKNK